MGNQSADAWTDAQVAPANFADWQRRNKLFSGIAAYNGQTIKADGGFNIVLPAQANRNS